MDLISNKNTFLRNSGDFKAIFDRYYMPLASYANRILNDKLMLEDVVQEAFLRLWENRERFRDEVMVRNFLYVVVKNLCLDFIGHSKVIRDNIRMIEEQYKDSGITDIDVESIYSIVYESIKMLPLQSRRIVLLTMQGKTNQEIASHLNISINTVKTLKMRAYKKIRIDFKNDLIIGVLLINVIKILGSHTN